MAGYICQFVATEMLRQPLSHGLPDRDVIEGGPPEELVNAFDDLFTAKIATTKIACAKARAEMGWPARQHL